MTMKITALEEYGLRCLLQIARGEKQGPSISGIAGKEGLSIQYVSKITAHLRKAGLIESRRGIKGGYRLVRKPEEVRLLDVMRALGGDMFAKEFCEEHTGRQRECVHEKNCSIRSVWNVLCDYMTSILQELTLRDLLDDEQKTKDKILEINLTKR